MLCDRCHTLLLCSSHEIVEELGAQCVVRHIQVHSCVRCDISSVLVIHETFNAIKLIKGQ